MIKTAHLIALFILINLLFSTILSAAESSLPWQLSPFMHVVQARTIQKQPYQVPLGSIKKIQSITQAEKLIWLNTKRQRFLIAQKSAHSESQDYLFFKQQIEQAGFQAAYTCAQGACGNSHYIAHTVLEQPELYTSDSTQHLGIFFKKNKDRTIALWLVYAIASKKKEHLILLDSMQINVVDSSKFLQLIRQSSATTSDSLSAKSPLLSRRQANIIIRLIAKRIKIENKYKSS